jgi:hypothetical protein
MPGSFPDMAAPAGHDAAAFEPRKPATDASGAHAPAPDGRPSTALRAPSVWFATLWHAAHRLAPYRHRLRFRRVLVEGTAPDPAPLALAALLPTVLLPAVFVHFKHVEATVANVL